MPALRNADQDQLHKLLLGQLPSAEVERLATEYADDFRLAELAESLAGQDDALLHLLHNHETAVVDPEGERLVERLVQRLKPAIPVQPRDDTAAVNRADASTEPSSLNVTAKPQNLPERLEYYRPIKVLGQGGMGTVYLAEDTRLGRQVAIKTLRPELAINPQAKERFLREARSAAKLEHDHIIPIYSVGEAADGTPFLAMPLLKGEPLDALIRRMAGPLPVATAVRLAREIASGLGAAHARGLIHRDIKPANIWLEAPTGRVKILDFGLAKAADAGSEADSETNLTASGAIVGTPAYMAPEQASGHPVDGRADLFSLGCVLYELLAGQRAFSGPNTMSILMSLANHTPTAPDKLSPQCPAAVSRLVMQLLEKDPAHRPESAEAVIQALSELDIAPATVSGTALAAGVSHEKLTPRDSTIPVASAIPLTASDSSLTLPVTMVSPVRKRAIPKQGVALALAGVLLMLLAAEVYRIQTDKGTLIVEINDDTVEAKLKTNGLEVHDSTSGRKFSIQAVGSHREASGDFKLVDGHGLKLVVLDADGLELTTNEFKLVRDGKVRVLVTAETNGVTSTTSSQALAADRRAAEYVLSIGGTITIKESGQEREIDAVADLPNGAFELTVVILNENPKVTDAGMAHFKGCTNLMWLGLYHTAVTDAGLAHFKDCKHLTTLSLGGTKVSDAGLAHFKDCKHLTALSLYGTEVSDAWLAHFKDCKNVIVLDLHGTRVSDVGLSYFKNCKDLNSLSLSSTKVTDAGLAHFKDCKNLTSVILSTTQASDAGLAHFKDCKHLTTLRLNNTEVSDAGMLYFKDCRDLMYLDLQGTRVSDLGLAHFKECKNLISLSLGSTKVGDAGLAYFKNCENLMHLNLAATEVGDAGLAHFRGCKNLTQLFRLDETQVSDAGLADLAGLTSLGRLQLDNTRISLHGHEQLKAALPKCEIPWSEPNRSVAESVLALGGTVEIGTLDKLESRTIKVVTDLPGDFFQVRRVSLADVAQPLGVLPTSLSRLRFPEFDRLESLDLSGITGLDYNFLVPIHGLRELTLANAGLTDESLAKLPKLHSLKRLVLDGNEIRGQGLTSLKEQPELIDLSLGCPTLPDLLAKNLAELKQVKRLSLAGSGLSDAGIKHLAGLTNLESLDLRRTKSTAVGVAELQKALPNCQIVWDHGEFDSGKK